MWEHAGDRALQELIFNPAPVDGAREDITGKLEALVCSRCLRTDVQRSHGDTFIIHYKTEIAIRPDSTRQ